MLKRTFHRTVLALGLGALALPVLAQDTYPSRPIKLVVPYAAGGPADMLARMVGERLAPRLGQPVVIENKPGTGGHTGAEQVAKGAPDGYTLVLATIAHNGAVKLYNNLRYDPAKDLQPVILVAESPSVLLVNQSVPANSVKELLALAQSKPGQLSYGSAGNGSAMHMAAELFRYMTKVDYVHVPYRGGAPAMADLLGGQIQLLFESLGTAHPHLKSGKVRAIAVTGTQRDPSLPDVPTVAEAGVPGYASVPWYTISAPAGVPAAVVNKLNAEINAVLKAPDLVERWHAQGVVALGGTPADALKRNQMETTKWNAVITTANIKVD
ncbi:MAG: tripartite tricarboxylate transporter substrate binding protein [Hydrogenophaga sp.]|jgi:tripartite-type tricarboxylate transporter receptor subunit TctC|uniref:tripartite tricarboxylate transporter substrate binding protein n=1 Tax=Hydrogenophaga sp. TaxID=1904254 RepID=UPI001DD57969|nr:tripartite tricarboxylate transporter substrate binding protein [Hydrogenophaga sp.]MBW0171827.1 tripartite tricarboxylate transporter substrate binding protein [Hydrogenophaga sp.]MBW0183917.1 tripartite tricarboxylate transporter substrate binding protein [Hydrogenophaga sp.]